MHLLVNFLIVLTCLFVATLTQSHTHI